MFNKYFYYNLISALICTMFAFISRFFFSNYLLSIVYITCIFLGIIVSFLYNLNSSKKYIEIREIEELNNSDLDSSVLNTLKSFFSILSATSFFVGSLFFCFCYVLSAVWVKFYGFYNNVPGAVSFFYFGYGILQLFTGYLLSVFKKDLINLFSFLAFLSFFLISYNYHLIACFILGSCCSISITSLYMSLKPYIEPNLLISIFNVIIFFVFDIVANMEGGFASYLSQNNNFSNNLLTKALKVGFLLASILTFFGPKEKQETLEKKNQDSFLSMLQKFFSKKDLLFFGIYSLSISVFGYILMRSKTIESWFLPAVSDSKEIESIIYLVNSGFSFGNSFTPLLMQLIGPFALAFFGSIINTVSVLTLIYMVSYGILLPFYMKLFVFLIGLTCSFQGVAQVYVAMEYKDDFSIFGINMQNFFAMFLGVFLPLQLVGSFSYIKVHLILKVFSLFSILATIISYFLFTSKDLVKKE